MKINSSRQVRGIESGLLPVSGGLGAEALLKSEVAALGEWLEAHGIDVLSDTAHVDEGSRDRLYWRYGYFAGVKRAMELLTHGAETVH